jgi:hypothetical protein
VSVTEPEPEPEPELEPVAVAGAADASTVMPPISIAQQRIRAVNLKNLVSLIKFFLL